MVYLPTFITIKSTIHVGKYASPMDPMRYSKSNDCRRVSKLTPSARQMMMMMMLLLLMMMMMMKMKMKMKIYLCGN